MATYNKRASLARLRSLSSWDLTFRVRSLPIAISGRPSIILAFSEAPSLTSPRPNPASTTIGNCKPFAAWTVKMRTESSPSSVEISERSVDSIRVSTHSRYSRQRAAGGVGPLAGFVDHKTHPAPRAGLHGLTFACGDDQPKSGVVQLGQQLRWALCVFAGM